ncbi:MAG: InlB B-repeat-containing protein [Anaeroplasmataceae bacterium]|nr:InlB B-repeat-containing protein [Anaeroplasmataceae bacterium]
MKKVLTTILAFLGLLALGVTIGVDAGVNSKSLEITITNFSEITTSYTTTFTHDYSVKDFSEEDVTIPVEAYGVYKNGSGIQMNKGKGTYIKNTVAFPGAITNISLEWTTSGKNSPTLYAAKDEVASNNSTKIADCSNTETSHSIDLGIENGYNYFYFDGTTCTGACYLKSLTITYSVEDTSATYYDVTFDSQNGTDPKTIQVKENEVVAQPTDPKKEGYLFTGWYQDEECTEAWDFENDTVTGDKTLYAGWETDTYSYAVIDSTNFVSLSSGSGYTPYNGSHILKNSDDTRNEFSYMTNQIMVQSGKLQFQKSNGYIYNESNVKGLITSIEIVDLDNEVTVYTSDSAIENCDELTGTVLSSTNTVYTLPEGAEHTYFAIKVGSSLTTATAIKIQYTYDETFAQYSVRFNAGKGTFKSGRGITLHEVEGTDITGTLPTADDLEKTAYKYTTLIGWSDGTTTYEPGDTFTVSGLTVFNAVYQTPELVTVSQAIEVAQLAGATKTDYKFVCEGIIASVDKTNTNSVQFTLKDLDGEDTIVVYNAKLSGTIYAGDKVSVTGNLMNFGGTTLEFIEGSTYVIKDNFISSFVNSKTKSSIKAEYDSDLFPVDVDLRFGSKLSLNAYKEDAVYGVMAIDKSSCAAFVSGATNYATADEFLAANTGVKKMECSNGALLEDGYQFAWVITDMEGHYNNSFTAVIYMEYNGVLYLGVKTVSSIVGTAQRYLDSEEPEIKNALTAEQRDVLQHIIDWEEEN